MSVERGIMATDFLPEIVDVSQVRREDTDYETRRVEAAREMFEKTKKDNAPKRPEMFAESRMVRKAALPDTSTIVEPVVVVKQDGQYGSKNGYSTLEAWMKASAGHNSPVNGRESQNGAIEPEAVRELAVVGAALGAVGKGERGSRLGQFIKRLGGRDDGRVAEKALAGGLQPPATIEGDGITEPPVLPVEPVSPDEGPTPDDTAAPEATASTRPSIVPIVKAKPVSGIAPDGVVPFPNITSALASRKESWLSRLWPFGKKSAPASSAVPATPAVTGTISSPKPTEREYTTRLGDAAGDLIKFRDSLGKNRADSNTLPNPAPQGESKHIGRKLVRAGALAAVLSLTSDQQQSSGPTYTIPEPKGGAPEGYVVPPPYAGAPIAGGSLGTSAPAETPVAPTPEPTPPPTPEPTETLPATAEVAEPDLTELIETRTRELVIKPGSSISGEMRDAGMMEIQEFNSSIYTDVDAAFAMVVLNYEDLVKLNPTMPPLKDLAIEYANLSTDAEKQAFLKKLANVTEGEERGYLDKVPPGVSITVPEDVELLHEISRQVKKVMANGKTEEARKAAFHTMREEIRMAILNREERQLSQIASNAINQAKEAGVIS